MCSSKIAKAIWQGGGGVRECRGGGGRGVRLRGRRQQEALGRWPRARAARWCGPGWWRPAGSDAFAPPLAPGGRRAAKAGAGAGRTLTSSGCATQVPSWPALTSRSLSARTWGRGSGGGLNKHAARLEQTWQRRGGLAAGEGRAAAAIRGDGVRQLALRAPAGAPEPAPPADKASGKSLGPGGCGCTRAAAPWPAPPRWPRRRP
jgi:hypothetical protein